MKRNLLFKTVCSTIFMGIAFASHGLAEERKVVNPKNFKPHGRPYSSSILAGDTLYISGQGSRDADGKMPEGFEAQVRQSLQNIRDILQGGNMDFENAVWMKVYLTDLNNYGVMNKVYWETIGKNPPARTVLGIVDLPAGNKVEINCIAVAEARSKKAIWPSGWKQGPNTDPPAVLSKDVLYCSGQGSRDPQSGKHPEGLSAQVKQALENVGEVLKAAGMSHRNVVWVNPYMDNFKQYEEMNQVYASFFEFGNTPGRGTIEVAQLPDQNHIVLSCIAGADLTKRKAIRPRNMSPSPTASPGILYGDTLYLSAKSGFIPGQGIVTPDLELQLRQTMRNLLDGLEEAGMDFSDVVSSTVYVKDMKDYDKMNNLYRTFFKEVFPARTTLQQSFDKETKTEEQISVIAVRRPKP
jgi:reactive intermediate/imine deaminase